MDPHDHQSIEQLLYRYPYYLDAGMFDEMGELFTFADVYIAGELRISRNGREVADLWRQSVRIFANGTPCTRHLIVNPLIEKDGPDRARAHSSVLVVQAPDGRDMRLVTAGDYLDRFEKIGGAWRFTERWVGNDLFGDMSRHLTRPMPVQGELRPQRWENV